MICYKKLDLNIKIIIKSLTKLEYLSYEYTNMGDFITFKDHIIIIVESRIH